VARFVGLADVPCACDPPKWQPVPLTLGGRQVRVYESEQVHRTEFLRVLDKEDEAAWIEDTSLPTRDEDGDEDMLEADEEQPSKAGGGRGSTDNESSDADAAVDELEAAARKLEHDVKYWSDFLKAQTHAKSLSLVEGYWEGVHTFDTFGEGRMALVESTERREAVIDRIRYFLEGCDSPQGMHCIADVSGGFAGFSSEILTELRDDSFSRKNVCLFASEPPRRIFRSALDIPRAMDEDPSSQSKRRIQSLGDAMCMGTLSDKCDLYVPLTSTTMKAAGMASAVMRTSSGLAKYWSAAPLAAAIDTLTLPYRLHSSTASSGWGASPSTSASTASHVAKDQPSAPITSMSQLHQLLRGIRSSSLACPYQACPFQPPIEELAAGLEAQDSRTPSRADKPTSSPNERQVGHNTSPLLRTALESLHELPRLDVEMVSSSEVQHYVWRGAMYSNGSPLQPEIGRTSLDHEIINWLPHRRPRQLPQRVLRHRTLIGTPLPVPLPFPRIWDEDMEAVSHLTLLETSPAFGATLKDAAALLKRSKHSGVEKDALTKWGYDADDVTAIKEDLIVHGDAYAQEEDTTEPDEGAL